MIFRTFSKPGREQDLQSQFENCGAIRKAEGMIFGASALQKINKIYDLDLQSSH